MITEILTDLYFISQIYSNADYLLSEITHGFDPEKVFTEVIKAKIHCCTVSQRHTQPRYIGYASLLWEFRKHIKFFFTKLFMHVP